MHPNARARAHTHTAARFCVARWCARMFRVSACAYVCARACGACSAVAVSQTIKDIVQSLVDDNLIEVDKIGSGNFYWAFPSKAYLTLKQKADGLETSLAAEEKTVADLEARLAELSSTTDDSVRERAHVPTQAHARMHARTHACTHARTCTHECMTRVC
ncbi:hypothetical protein EON67_09230, partial [archaeon]